MKRLKPLIGICGAAGSGKDTLAQGIAAMDVYFVYSLADPIKAAINAMFGFGPVHWEDRDWKEKPIPWLSEPDFEGVAYPISPRTLAQTLGTQWGREMVDPEIWLKIADHKFQKISNVGRLESGRIMGLGMIVPDIRFENEARWIRENDGLLLKVVRPGQETISENSHATETGLDILCPELIDAVVTNDAPPSKMIMEARRILWESSGLSVSSRAD